MNLFSGALERTVVVVVQPFRQNVKNASDGSRAPYGSCAGTGDFAGSNDFKGVGNSCRIFHSSCVVRPYINLRLKNIFNDDNNNARRAALLEPTRELIFHTIMSRRYAGLSHPSSTTLHTRVSSPREYFLFPETCGRGGGTRFRNILSDHRSR